ncbi:hypothetical protein M1271_00320 [Patescibacteria group bacterium]|nr:hypothetical protein [Patescibacteria group bacterium]
MQLSEADAASIHRIFDSARRVKELSAVSERISRLQMITAQPFVYSSIIGAQEYTSNRTNDLSTDEALDELFNTTNREGGDIDVWGIMDRAYDLCTDYVRIEGLANTLSPLVLEIQAKTPEEIDKFVASRTVHKDMAQFTNYHRAIGLEYMLDDYKEVVRPIFSQLSAIRAARDIFNKAWTKMKKEGISDERFQELLDRLNQSAPERLRKLVVLLSSPLIRDPFVQPDVFPFEWEMPVIDMKDSRITVIPVNRIKIENKQAKDYQGGIFPHIQAVSDYWMIRSGDNLELMMDANNSNSVRDDLIKWNRAFLALGPNQMATNK